LILTLLSFNSCAKRKLKIYDGNSVISKMHPVAVFHDRHSVAFQWREISDKRVEGIHVYRGDTKQDFAQYRRIKTIQNPYAQNFVDTTVSPDHNYSYAFTVFSKGKESKPSDKIVVKMAGALSALDLLEAFILDNKVVKLHWSIHPNSNIKSYIIERSINEGKWSFLSAVQGRLMSEYIDDFVQEEQSYRYRIIALSYAKIRSYPSEASLAVKIKKKK